MVELFSIFEKKGYKHLTSLSTQISDSPHERPEFDDTGKGIRVIMIGDLKYEGILNDKPKYITPKYHNKLKSTKLRKNDLLMARIGVTTGVTSLVNDDNVNSNISGNITLIRLKDANEAKFLLHYINSNFFQKYLQRVLSNSARDFLTVGKIKSLKVLNIDGKIKDYVIETLDSAIKLKQERIDKNKSILNNIDNFLLSEIGVVLPLFKENLIENRIFNTGWQKVTGNRLDPKKYSYQSESLIACIENSKLRKVPLKSLVIHSVAGDWGLDEKEEVNPKLFTKCLVIRATEFDNDYNLNIENSRAKFRLISNTKLKKLDIKPQDFLLEKSGGSPDQPVGRISILENELLENNTIAYSNFIHKFRVNTDEVLPEFLFCFLKTIHNIKLTDVMQSQTNGIRNLIMREYWNQSIILPDKKKQKEIADTIYQMRAEAKQTEIDAQLGFEQTKKEIEKLILE